MCSAFSIIVTIMIAATTAAGIGTIAAGIARIGVTAMIAVGTVVGIAATIIAMTAAGIARTGIIAMIADGAVSDAQTKPRPKAGVFRMRPNLCHTKM
ncbi:hypothetical protein C5750_23375 [Phyllobacterium myrsinacearum]|uniref:Uncharacterized protein n=1 Tax=Phyllobacterium myrsinacearum TaxID=28101 RepID=A0A2S9JBS3_9HYPH|nr:hypothetical protein C5750_23375 [Phyllobacterium myrsinacearum]